MSIHQKPRPRVGPDSAPFWKGCREHRLMLPTCAECGKAHLPPGPVCPFCLSDAIEWKRASGRGRISTWTMVHKAWFPAFAAETPYNVVQVELDAAAPKTGVQTKVVLPPLPRLGPAKSTPRVTRRKVRARRIRRRRSGGKR